jgi:hypothetical protein
MLLYSKIILLLTGLWLLATGCLILDFKGGDQQSAMRIA